MARGIEMRGWGFWEWIGFTSLWIAATLLALDGGIKISSPEFRSHVPAFVEGAAWAFLPVSFVALGTVVLVIRALSRPRDLFAVPITKPGSIEIFFKSDAPYEVSDVQHHHVLSTVRIGLHNIGGTPLSNCKVYVEKISPEPALPGGLPILLEGGGFTLRHDDPEKLVDIASHWDHVEQYRFNAPLGVGFAETLQFIDDKLPRTIVIKIEASGYQRSATFRIWTDISRALHLEYIGYVN